jgi:6-phosphogluconolactonase
VSLRIERLADADAVARRAAAEIAAAARDGVAARGRFAFAMSGGRTPWAMLDALAGEDVPWAHVHLFQVDERDAPDGHAERNWTHVAAHLLDRVAMGERAHAMPVGEPDRDAAARRYAATLARVCGGPPVLDLVHLGLGADGHTASLVPGDPVLAVRDADVAWSQPYQGRARMTLTFPALDRARRVLFVVTGEEKRAALAGLVRGDRALPAARVAASSALVLTDLGD